MEKYFEKIQKHMAKPSYRPVKREELVKTLAKHEGSDGDWLKVIIMMERNGLVVRNQSGKVGLPHQMGFCTGKMQVHPKGFGFLIPDNDHEDVYIERDQLKGAMHGDKVLIRRIGKDPMERRPEGEVVKILERANQTLVGTFQKTHNYGFVIPDNPRILDHILISAQNTRKAKEGEKVLVSITEWPKELRLPEGRILEVMGKAGDERVERTAVLLKNGIRELFPDAVIQETDDMNMQISEQKDREDLRNLLTVTIDGEDAKDLDDAVSFESVSDHRMRLGVHIADVSHYVQPDSATDQEARSRCTSVYLVGHVVPMLPARLSNDLCSLNEGEDKLTMTVFIDLDDQGSVLEYRITPSLCRIDHRLTYEAVSAMLADHGESPRPGDEMMALLQGLDRISAKLREKRFESGSIDFDLSESKIILDEKGEPLEILKAERLPAHNIIEECMLLANRLVADHLKKNRIPGIYRVHEPPQEEAFAELKSMLSGFGFSIGSRRSGSVKAIQKILEQSYSRPEGPMIRRSILQTMERAHYAAESSGHFALGFKDYLHFTSPIRRYPDLIVHRMLHQHMQTAGKGQKVLNKWVKEMGRIASESSLKERAAMEAENEWMDRKKAELMQKHLGDEFTGIISGITGFGMFVELENTVEGLVHISNMDDDYYTYDEKSMTLKGRSTRKEFKIGSEVVVQVTKVDLANRQIDFALV